MPTIALMSLKGGVGKTTIAINLAAELGASRLFDLDPQGHASTWAGLAGEQAGDGDGFQVARDVIQIKAPSALALKHELDRFGDQLVILDLPPALEDAADVASMLADIVLIPAAPSPLDIAAAREAVTLCRDARKLRGTRNKLPIVRLIPNRLQVGTRLARDTPIVLAELGEKVAPALHNRVAYVDAAIEGSVVSRVRPNTDAHREIKALGKTIKEILKTL